MVNYRKNNATKELATIFSSPGCQFRSRIIIYQDAWLVRTPTLLPSPVSPALDYEWERSEKNSPQSGMLARRNVLKGLKLVQFSYLWHFCCAVLTLSSSVWRQTLWNKSLQTLRTNIVMAAVQVIACQAVRDLTSSVTNFHNFILLWKLAKYSLEIEL